MVDFKFFTQKSEDVALEPLSDCLDAAVVLVERVKKNLTSFPNSSKYENVIQNLSQAEEEMINLKDELAEEAKLPGVRGPSSR